MSKINKTCASRKRLELLVQEAKRLIDDSKQKYGRAEVALLDMIGMAEAALNGKKFPFSYGRQFWTRTENDEVNFALQHYTMVPSFFMEGKGYGNYGLEEAIEWYRYRDKHKLQNPSNIRLKINQPEDGNFFLSNSEIEEIRSKINKDAFFREQFEEICKIADVTTLEELLYSYHMNFCKEDYRELKKHFDLWRPSGNGANFGIPEKGVKARVLIRLLPEDNEEDGLGHIWLRKLCLKAENGEVIQIRNEVESNEVVYLENANTKCCSTWISEVVTVYGGMNYTLSFEALQEGKFKRGVGISVVSYDVNEKVVDEYHYFYNKKSWIPIKNYNLSMQCNSIVYMVTNNVTYAEKAKIEMLHMLDDFCQGAYYWMTYNERPEGLDCYGAVQAGRNLCSLAVTYALIEKAHVFTKEEKALFYELVDFILRYCLDLRDRTELSYEEAQKGASNWQTDMCIGVSLMLFALKDFSNRELWLENAYAVIYGQIITNLNADGSWPESIRYHYAVLEKFATYARVLKRMTGIDWFADTRILEMFSYGIDIQTPAYKYFDDCISTPPFGDHKLSNGTEFAIYGLYLKEAASIDKTLADKMYLTWVAAGKKRKGLWGESIAVENLLYPLDYEVPATSKLELASTKKYKDAGIYVFRNMQDNSKEDYLAVMSSQKKIGHGHLDQGSFILFKDSVPVIMDSGIEGYFDVSTPWHISSYSHACVLFKAEKIERMGNLGFINLSAGTYTQEQGYWDTPDKSVVRLCDMGKRIESIQIEIPHVKGRGKHIRRIEVDSIERTWKIQDSIEEYEGEVLFSLPLVAQTIHRMENRIHIEGYYGVELEIEVKSIYKSMRVEIGRTTPIYPSDEEQQYLKYLRIYAEAEDGFCIEIK